MTKFKTSAVYKVTKEASGKDLELGNLYLKNVPVTFAQVLKPGKKYNSDDKAYSMNVFVDSNTMDALDKIGINKELAEVGVTKIKKGKNRGNIKYPLDEHNTPYEGMFAAQFSRNVEKRNAEGEVIKVLSPLKVIGSDGEPFTEEVGNGSVCHIRTFAYRNTDDALVLMLDTVVVLEHVPYVREDGFFDDELGITIKASETKVEEDNVRDEFGSDESESDTDGGEDTDGKCPF